MADSKPYAMNRKMKERDARLVAAKQVKISASANEPRSSSLGETSQVTPPASLDSSTSSSIAGVMSEATPESITTEDPGIESETDHESKTEDGGEFTDQQVQKTFNNFMSAIPINDHRMLAVLCMENFRKWQSMQVVDAAREAAFIVDYSDQTVRKARKEFFENRVELEERKQGKYKESLSTVMKR